MKREKMSLIIICGLISFLAGAFLGGLIGLSLGGTFLGSLNIHERIGIEGYELTTYIGAIIGAIIATIFGVKLILKKINMTNEDLI